MLKTPPNQHASTEENQAVASPHDRGKNSWASGVRNWFQLLIFPLILLLAIIWIALQQTQIHTLLNQQQQITKQIATDQQQETIMLAYQEYISNMILHEHLLDTTDRTVKRVATAYTLTTLRKLDVEHKSEVLRFLYNTKLLDEDFQILDLAEADLHNANLRQLYLNESNLYGIDFSGADLRGAIITYSKLTFVNFTNANLEGADLHSSDMRNANLSGANLSHANLKDVVGLTQEQLNKAKSLKGAIMPDGSVHP